MMDMDAFVAALKTSFNGAAGGAIGSDGGSCERRAALPKSADRPVEIVHLANQWGVSLVDSPVSVHAASFCSR